MREVRGKSTLVRGPCKGPVAGLSLGVGQKGGHCHWSMVDRCVCGGGFRDQTVPCGPVGPRRGQGFYSKGGRHPLEGLSSRSGGRDG